MGTEDTPSSAAVEPAQERFSFMPFVEMGKDLRRRKPHYLSDWTDGFHRKVLSSSLFMFFTSIGPAITFAALLNLKTEVDGRAQIGPVEGLFEQTSHTRHLEEGKKGPARALLKNLGNSNNNRRLQEGKWATSP
jgi:hypothetical protein